MKADIDAAKAGLARAEALPDDAPQKPALIGQWRGELKMLHAHISQDRRARDHTFRFYRAQRKAVA